MFFFFSLIPRWNVVKSIIIFVLVLSMNKINEGALLKSNNKLINYSFKFFINIVVDEFYEIKKHLKKMTVVK